jgi:hypothetical protein
VNTVFIILSSILTLAAGLPYLRDLIRGKTKPRVVTWLVWSIVTGLAATASLSDHQYASAVLTASETVETLVIAVFAYVRARNRAIETLDVVCLVGAGIGLVVWQFFHAPAAAVVASVIIDLIGSLPTIKHMWQKPQEETWLTFALSTLAGLSALLAATDLRITEIASPIAIMVVNGVFAVIIVRRRRRRGRY